MTTLKDILPKLKVGDRVKVQWNSRSTLTPVWVREIVERGVVVTPFQNHMGHKTLIELHRWAELV
jgi:hypothetical protein